MKDIQQNLSIKDTDPFGLKNLNLHTRVPEKSEMFSKEEAETYIRGCDYPQSADDLLFAWEICDRVGDITHKKILDAMCGPGRLGRELLGLGVQDVVFHDGDQTMMTHAMNEATRVRQPGQSASSIVSQADDIPVPDGMFDLVLCHNSTHQMGSQDKLQEVMKEFVRIIKPGGLIIIADYQRNSSGEFLSALEERLFWTKPEIVPLLLPTFTAAFSKEEWRDVVEPISGIANWDVTDATVPKMNSEMKKRAKEDPVKGHMLDFSPISLRIVIRKEGT